MRHVWSGIKRYKTIHETWYKPQFKLKFITLYVHFYSLNPFQTNGIFYKVSKGAKTRNQYNQVPHLTQYTNGKVTKSQLDTTNESQEVSPFPAGDHKAHINKHTKAQQAQDRKNINDPQKK